MTSADLCSGIVEAALVVTVWTWKSWSVMLSHMACLLGKEQLLIFADQCLPTGTRFGDKLPSSLRSFHIATASLTRLQASEEDVPDCYLEQIEESDDSLRVVIEVWLALRHQQGQLSVTLKTLGQGTVIHTAH